MHPNDYLCRMYNVLRIINGYYPLSADTEKLLRESVTRIVVPPRTLLIRSDCRNGYAYFIERGITRSFWLIDGEEVTTSFAYEGYVVFSMDELYYDQESEEFVETIEECEVYRIAIPLLRHLFETNLEICNWCRIIHQNEYRRLHRIHKEILTLPASDRYEAFRNHFPDVCKRVNLGFIASYLGMTQPTLSRIRGKK